MSTVCRQLSPIQLFPKPIYLEVFGLPLFLIYKAPAVLKNDPQPMFLSQDDFLPARNHSFSRFDNLRRNFIRFIHRIALISLCVPLRIIIGVSRHGGLNPPVSPYPP